ncbi:12480_t:CDS:2 [Dentiscutata heterogama]|uniref:12480_t:CDS:1 n=1 Tax=Dentiscutata heterogama TaxID=1316150 RepID=A0ACA9MPZ2_9GLOM|nr:12480_t:CDS:2 [Dentiscutata heterogama]
MLDEYDGSLLVKSISNFCSELSLHFHVITTNIEQYRQSYTTITKVKEYKDFINGSSKLSVIFFHSTYCIYSQIVVSVFAELSSRYEEHAKFAMVVHESASSSSVVEEALVNAFPTFLFFKNGVEIERLVGADRTKMIRLLLKHIKMPRENEENDSNSLIKVNRFIKRTQVECLNQHLDQQEEHIQSIFKNDDTCLESNDGAELIISIPFNQAIDLHSIKIVHNNIDQAPKEVKLFINRPIILSFDDAEAIKETQKLEFIRADYENNTIIPLKSVKFQKVTNIVLYIKNNIGDNETTVIKELIFYGKHLLSPLISEKICLQISSMDTKLQFMSYNDSVEFEKKPRKAIPRTI